LWAQLSTLQKEKKGLKKSGWNRIPNQDPVITVAVLYQLSYQVQQLLKLHSTTTMFFYSLNLSPEFVYDIS